MRITRVAVPIFSVLAAGACSDVPAPTEGTTTLAATRLGDRLAERYVAIGTSISMGWASNGVYAASQSESWPSMLAFKEHSEFTQPFIEEPGCTSPLVAPLGGFRRLSGESAAPSRMCAPNTAGVTLPTHNVAIAGAIAAHALLSRPEVVGAAIPWYTRVLPTGHTQLTAALSQNPTLVSVELGGNEVLNAASGLVADGVTMVPLPNFVAPYTAILNAIQAEGRKVVLIGMPADARDVPLLRRADEIWADREAFAALNVTVSENCETSENWINVGQKSLGIVAAAAASPTPVTYSCADAPGIDFVLTPANIEFINARMAVMDAFIRSQAEARGFAYASLGAIYDNSRGKGGAYSIVKQLTSEHPYGPHISLDGVHPSAVGNTMLAVAVAKAIRDRYDVRVSLAARATSAVGQAFAEQATATYTLRDAKAAAARLRGTRLPACPMPGECLLK